MLGEPEELYYYQERSTFLVTTPSTQNLEIALEILKLRPNVNGPCDLRFFQTGGAINDEPATSTAFVHRNSQWLGVVGYYWEYQDDLNKNLVAEGHDWQNRFYEFILRGPNALFDGKGAYQNFPDISLHDWDQAYFGENLPRLKEIKARYDPQELFNFEQGITNKR